MRRASTLVARLQPLAVSGAARGGSSTAAAFIVPAGRYSTVAAAAATAEGGAAGRQRWVAVLAACLAAGVGAGAYAYALRPESAQCRAAPGGELPPAAAQLGAPAGGKRKTRVVVLGTGWAAVSFLKSLDSKLFGEDGPYELVVVSPRTYFLYTPLLPSAAAGSVQERSIVEPIRNVLNGMGNFYQAAVTSIDAAEQKLQCAYHTCEVCKLEEGEHCPKQGHFELPYDILVLSVGSVNNTFGIKGVQEHCFFMKSIEDAHRLRVHISKMVEHAALPTLPPEERRRHLNFVVVGGGPTGVELAAELHDLVTEDVARLIPQLKQDISITVVDTADHLLGAFDRELSNYTKSHFLREGIKVQLGTMVKGVSEGQLTVKRNGGEEPLEFGTCVWATGVAMHPLVNGLRQQLPVELQNSRAGVLVDEHLRVRGSNGTVFAIGDCAVTHHDKALPAARELFSKADTNNDGRLSEAEVLAMLEKVRRRYPQMGEMAALLAEGLLEKAARGVWGGSSQKLDRYARHVERLKQGLTFDDFQDLLSDMDTLLRPLPPTAQVAAQEGMFLAKLFSQHTLAPVPAAAGADAGAAAQPAVAAAAAADAGTRGCWWWPWPRRAKATAAAQSAAAGAQEVRQLATISTEVPLPEGAAPFEYRHRGSFSYIGVDQAVLDLPSTFPFKALKGWLVGLTWRSFETWRQVSLRNKLRVQADWLHRRIFGRAGNMTEV